MLVQRCPSAHHSRSTAAPIARDTHASLVRPLCKHVLGGLVLAATAGQADHNSDDDTDHRPDARNPVDEGEEAYSEEVEQASNKRKGEVDEERVPRRWLEAGVPEGDEADDETRAARRRGGDERDPACCPVPAGQEGEAVLQFLGREDVYCERMIEFGEGGRGEDRSREGDLQAQSYCPPLSGRM